MIATLRSARTLVTTAVVMAAMLLLPATTQGAATITILNNDGAGEGFNDPTPVAPVGGNTGTTLGQQRLLAFQHAINIWGATLTSSTTIVVRANFDPLTCNATSAVLGSAGPVTVSANFPNAPLSNTLYHAAQANALAGTDLVTGQPDIAARFNSVLGQAGCLTGTFFYLGLDNNHGAQIDLVTHILHELAHGLGFSTVTDLNTGAQLVGFPSVFDHFLFDNSQSLSWVAMSNAQRAASAINVGGLAWTGANVTATLPGVLRPASGLTATSPAAIAGSYLVGLPAFGPPLTVGGLSGEVMPVVDQADGTGLACTPLSATNILAVNGKIALIDRGTCAYTDKVKNAQNAGAIGVIIVNNAPGTPPPAMGGSDPTITIPSVQITQADGVTFKSALRFRSRTRSGVLATMHANPGTFEGVDAAGRALMFTPNPLEQGRSVNHWDTRLTPNQLLEPPGTFGLSGDLTHSVTAPADLTFALLRDIGWP